MDARCRYIHACAKYQVYLYQSMVPGTDKPGMHISCRLLCSFCYVLERKILIQIAYQVLHSSMVYHSSTPSKINPGKK